SGEKLEPDPLRLSPHLLPDLTRTRYQAILKGARPGLAQMGPDRAESSIKREATPRGSLFTARTELKCGARSRRIDRSSPDHQLCSLPSGHEDRLLARLEWVPSTRQRNASARGWASPSANGKRHARWLD